MTRNYKTLPPEATKTCAACGETKPETAFPWQDGSRRRAACTPCHNVRRRTRGEHTRRQRETPEERRTRLLWETYRLTPEQYQALLDAQGSVCAMCRKAPSAGKRLVVDHCHTTGRVRALLCTYCNVVVGMYENHRQTAAEYLAAYGDGSPVLNAQGATR